MEQGGAPIPREPSVHREFGSRRVMLAIVVSIVLGIVLPPLINVNRYRSEVSRSLSAAVGRPVTIGHVGLRLLPQPGFDLRNVEVGDDPSMSAEYFLHSDSVTAYLRLSSLWRGRLEIARLTLSDPSLNLVRARDGRWNIETLLSRTAQIPTAPTAQAHFESSRRRFPYIEATGGRINFKFGLEKKAFTFTEADFALWLEAENVWNMRLEAKPVRVDTRVTDTGLLRMEGSFQRNSTLRYTPVKLRVDWRNGQLGQMTKLLTGRDRGWRGGTSLSIVGTGTPADLAITSDLRVDDFRRYDIFGGGTMRMLAHCTSKFSAVEEKLNEIACNGPVGGGEVELTGTAERWSDPLYDLAVNGHDVSLNSVMGFVRHAKRDLPEDLSANGTTEFSLTARKAADPAAHTLWSGGGSTNNLVLHSEALGPDLELGTLRYNLASQPPDKPIHTIHGGRATPTQGPNQFRMAIAPFALPLGTATPSSGQAVVTAAGFSIGIAGDADLARALQVARALGISTPKVAANGEARFDLHVEGHWTGFEAPVLTGNAHIKNAQADIPGVIETMAVNSATVSIDARALSLLDVVASFPKGPNFTGSVYVPHSCGSAPCPITFTVHADELSPERLNQLFNPKFRSRPWYNFFMPRSEGKTNPLPDTEATGGFGIEHWKMGTAVAAHVSGGIKIGHLRVTVSEMRGELFGGQHSGEWQADFSGTKPIFSGKGKLAHANLSLVAAAMQDAWATGTGDLGYQLKMTGLSRSDLRSSASGIGDFTLHDGTLRHMGLDSKANPLKVNKAEGTIELRDGNFVFSDAKLQSGSAVYSLQGSATWTRELNFKLTDNQHSYALSGTLEKPEVQQAPATEAALKP
jgi:hypothetical protein